MLSDEEIRELQKRNRSAYEGGSSPNFPTTVLTEADLPAETGRQYDGIPENINVVSEQPLVLDLKDWLYVSDLHIPFHNREYIRRLLAVADKRGIKDCIIGGDFYNFSKMSKHPKTEATEDANKTLMLGGQLIERLAQTFERIYFLPGNHDLFFAKKLDTFFSYENLIWAGIRGSVRREQIVVTNLDYIYVGPQETGWVVGHPRFFSSVPAKGISDVALLKRRHVVGAHNHIVGMMQSKDARFWAIDPGHCTEPDLTPYHLQSDGLSRFPVWRPGFLLVTNNIPRLMTDGLVDWSEFGAG